LQGKVRALGAAMASSASQLTTGASRMAIGDPSVSLYWELIFAPAYYRDL
jgi:hypothetical protein